jgi:hypothetical protein
MRPLGRGVDVPRDPNDRGACTVVRPEDGRENPRELPSDGRENPRELPPDGRENPRELSREPPRELPRVPC